jgi:hypothetical protein
MKMPIQNNYTGSSIRSTPQSQLAFEEERKFFRCPGCGENVDSSNIPEVVAHHRHVLHPALYPFARKSA